MCPCSAVWPAARSAMSSPAAGNSPMRRDKDKRAQQGKERITKVAVGDGAGRAHPKCRPLLVQHLTGTVGPVQPGCRPDTENPRVSIRQAMPIQDRRRRHSVSRGSAHRPCPRPSSVPPPVAGLHDRRRHVQRVPPKKGVRGGSSTPPSSRVSVCRTWGARVHRICAGGKGGVFRLMRAFFRVCNSWVVVQVVYRVCTRGAQGVQPSIRGGFHGSEKRPSRAILTRLRA